MAVMISVVWFAQFFIAGLPMMWVAVLSLAGVCGMVGAYFALPHVALRIDRFLDPSAARLPDQPLASRRSSMAGCSAAARARARSSCCCPTRTPTSCSP